MIDDEEYEQDDGEEVYHCEEQNGEEMDANMVSDVFANCAERESDDGEEKRCDEGKSDLIRCEF